MESPYRDIVNKDPLSYLVVLIKDFMIK